MMTTTSWGALLPGDVVLSANYPDDPAVVIVKPRRVGKRHGVPTSDVYVWLRQFGIDGRTCHPAAEPVDIIRKA